MATLVILAAGMGNRFGGLKQVLPVGPAGESLMEYAIYDARQAGFARVVFVLRQLFFTEFRNRIGRRVEKWLETRYVFQETERLLGDLAISPNRRKPWGTGHALLTARKEITGSFAVINADDYYGPGAFRAMMSFFSRSGDRGNACAMIGYPLGETLSDHGDVSRGICEYDSRGMVMRIREVPGIHRKKGKITASAGEEDREELSADRWISMNFWGLKPGIFPLLEARFQKFIAAHHRDLTAEFYIPEVVNRLLSHRLITVKILPAEDRWFGLTYRGDLPAVQSMIRQRISAGVYPQSLFG